MRPEGKTAKPDSTRGFRVGITLVSRDLDPEALTRTRQLPPTRSWKRGEEVDARDGRQLVRTRGLWDHEIESPDLAEAIEQVISALAPRRQPVAEAVRGAPESSVFLSLFPARGAIREVQSSHFLSLVSYADHLHVYFFGLADKGAGASADEEPPPTARG